MEEKMRDIINEWNPIEIYPLLIDEYNYEIKRIIDGSSNCTSKESLSNLIYNVFFDSFGSEFKKSKESCEKIAEVICDFLQLQ